jgi:excisionase family DNA binding protein
MLNPDALQCLSTVEVAELLTVDRSTVTRMIGRGELPAIKIGGRTVIKATDLADYLEQHRVAAS